MDTMEVLLVTSYIFGCLICILLSVSDFQKNVPKYQTNKLRIITLNTFFVIVILLVYIGLLYILVGLTIIKDPPYISTISRNTEFEKFRLISPLLLSIIYFGASKSCLTIGGKDICVYDRILQVFINFLSIPFDQKELLPKIQKEKVKALQKFLREVDDKAIIFGVKSSGKYNDLEKLRNDMDKETDRVEFLDDIQSRNEKIVETLEREKQKLEKATEIYLEELKTKVKDLIETNTSNPLFAEFAIGYFDIAPIQKKIKHDKVPYPIIRSITMALVGALPISLIFERTQTDYEIVVRIFLIASALFAFLIWFVWLPKFLWKLESAFYVILLGIVAGVCGSLVFELVKPDGGILNEWIQINWMGKAGEEISFSLPIIFKSLEGNSVFEGLIMGMTSSLIVYLFRYTIVKRIENMVLLYVTLAGTGFLVAGIGRLLWLIVRKNEIHTFFDYWNLIWPQSAMIAVLCVVIGLVSNVLHIERWSLDISKSNNVHNR